MNRLTSLPFVLVAVLVAVYAAPGFVFSVLASAFLIVFGVRWFIRASSRPRSRGMWR
ncbi:hypothetical protein [Nocardia sp. NPDC059154]|uniref:hypothetical protein n=1 Tax=Nocardia sp. NPDC059154 TaxID=3346744 RepID=UPI0036BA6D39